MFSSTYQKIWITRSIYGSTFEKKYQKSKKSKISSNNQHFQIAISTISMRPKSQIWPKSGYIQNPVKQQAKQTCRRPWGSNQVVESLFPRLSTDLSHGSSFDCQQIPCRVPCRSEGCPAFLRLKAFALSKTTWNHHICHRKLLFLNIIRSHLDWDYSGMWFKPSFCCCTTPHFSLANKNKSKKVGHGQFSKS